VDAHGLSTVIHVNKRRNLLGICRLGRRFLQTPENCIPSGPGSVCSLKVGWLAL